MDRKLVGRENRWTGDRIVKERQEDRDDKRKSKVNETEDIQRDRQIRG